MKILAVPNFARYESACAVITDDGDAEHLNYYTIDEERLFRIKHTYGFPLLAMDYCLKRAGIENLAEVDLLVTDYARKESMYNDGPGYRKLEHDYLKGILDIDRSKIVIANHHLAHAAGVFYPSGFEEAAVLVVDGMGSGLETQSVFHATGHDIRLLERGGGWGLGGLYSEITSEILGFTGLNGVDLAGKTMGLAPLGRNEPGPILNVAATYEGMKSDYSRFMTRFPKPRLLPNNLRQCRDPRDVTNSYFSRIAYDVQEEAERAMIHFARHAYKLTKSKNLCITGGVGLNSVANGKILENTPFEKIYITPCCSDTGIALALAVYGYYHHAKSKKRKKFYMPTAYTGKTYDRSEIRELLKRCQIPAIPRNLPDIASELVNQKIVGWFVGGSEIGPRALGHRSILVDPRRAEMKDILNARVKHREAFRPFAPAILEECVSEYFPISHKTPFMVEVYPFREEVRQKAGAVAHVDGTGRLQTVSAAESPEYYELIKAFHGLTGIPILLNTSFNDKEPIVESPRDALITFLSTEIDLLVLEDLVVHKSALTEEKCALVAKALTEERSVDIQRGIEETKRKYFRGYAPEDCRSFIETEELLAVWHLKYRAKYELEKFIDQQVRVPERIVIVGCSEHTRVLYERIYDFPRLRVEAFVPFQKSQPGEVFKDIYPVVTLDEIRTGDYDKVLVSSHEFQFEIIDWLDKTGVPEWKRVILYDTAGDTLEKHLKYLPVYNPLKS